MYHHIIEVNIPLDQPTSQHRIPDYTILISDSKKAEQQITWLYDYDGDIEDSSPSWHRLGRIGTDYLVRFTDYADFIIDEEKRVIRCYPETHLQVNTIEHLLLDQVLPRVLSRRSFLVVHASAVMTPNGVLAFIGKTGYGKSTLTAFYGQHGCSIITDDCLVLQQEKHQFLALPSYPAIRLNPDMAAIVSGSNCYLPNVAEYSTKLRLNPTQGKYVSHNNPEVLHALFVLAEPDKENVSDSVCIERCSMREAFSLLIENVFRLDPTDKQNITDEFKRLNALVSIIPIYRLTYPRHHSAMSDIIHATFDLLKDQKRN